MAGNVVGTRAIAVLDAGQLLSCSYEEIMKYHGCGSPGGVAHAFKVMERAWPERFVFRLGYRESAVTLLLCEGYVTEEFIELAREPRRSDEQERRLSVLKREMADRVMAAPAEEVYGVVAQPWARP